MASGGASHGCGTAEGHAAGNPKTHGTAANGNSSATGQQLSGDLSDGVGPGDWSRGGTAGEVFAVGEWLDVEISGDLPSSGLVLLESQVRFARLML